MPVVVAWAWRAGERRAALAGTAACVAVLALASAPFAGQGYVDAFRFQLDRPVQVESTPAAVLYALGGTRVTGSDRTPDRFESNGLVGGAAGAVEALFAALLAATVALLSWLAALRRDRRHVLICSCAAVVAFVALGKVLSPQYMAWIAVPAALLWAWRQRAAALLLAAAIVLSQVEFPRRYAMLVHGDAGVRALVAVRDAALVAALGLLIATAAGSARSRRHGRLASSAPAPP